MKNKWILVGEVCKEVDGNPHTSAGSAPREHLGAPQNRTLNPLRLSQARGRHGLGDSALCSLLKQLTLPSNLFDGAGVGILLICQVPRLKELRSAPWLRGLPCHLRVLSQNRTQVGSTMSEIPLCYSDPALGPSLPHTRSEACSSVPVWTLAGLSHDDATSASSFSLRLSFFVCPTGQVPGPRVDEGPEWTVRASGRVWFLSPTMCSASRGKQETQKLPLAVSLLILPEFIKCCLEDERRWWMIRELTRKGWIQPCVTVRLF